MSDNQILGIVFLVINVIFIHIALVSISMEFCKTSAQVLVLILLPIFGLLIGMAMRRINEIESGEHKKVVEK